MTRKRKSNGINAVAWFAGQSFNEHANQLATLRAAAYAADDRYSAELRRVYGKHAGDARYKYHHDDPRVEAAARAKQAADEAYRQAGGT